MDTDHKQTKIAVSNIRQVQQSTLWRKCNHHQNSSLSAILIEMELSKEFFFQVEASNPIFLCSCTPTTLFFLAHAVRARGSDGHQNVCDWSTIRKLSKKGNTIKCSKQVLPNCLHPHHSDRCKTICTDLQLLEAHSVPKKQDQKRSRCEPQNKSQTKHDLAKHEQETDGLDDRVNSVERKKEFL